MSDKSCETQLSPLKVDAEEKETLISPSQAGCRHESTLTLIGWKYMARFLTCKYLLFKPRQLLMKGLESLQTIVFNKQEMSLKKPCDVWCCNIWILHLLLYKDIAHDGEDEVNGFAQESGTIAQEDGDIALTGFILVWNEHFKNLSRSSAEFFFVCGFCFFFLFSFLSSSFFQYVKCSWQ